MAKGNIKKLRQFRMDSGYTIYSLADKLGVNYSTVSYWETGKKVPRINILMQLEDLFNVSYRELFSDLTEDEVKSLEERVRPFQHNKMT